MGRRGPLPKPTALKILQGNPGKRALPKNEPKPNSLIKIPPPPDHLSEMARAAWRNLATPLYALELLSELDTHALEAYCIAYAHWRSMYVEVESKGHTIEFLDENGNVKYAQPTPEASLMLKYAAEMSRWSKVLGLGPAYRVGLNGNPDPHDDSDSILEALHG